MAKNFIALFKQHPIGLFGGCLRNDKCKIENVRVKCGTTTSTRKRREIFKTKKPPKTYLRVEFTVTVPLTNTSKQELNKTTDEISQNFTSDLKNMDLGINISGVEMSLDKTIPPVIAVQDYVCDKGQVKIGSHCGEFLYNLFLFLLPLLSYILFSPSSLLEMVHPSLIEKKFNEEHLSVRAFWSC